MARMNWSGGQRGRRCSTSRRWVSGAGPCRGCCLGCLSRSTC